MNLGEKIKTLREKKGLYQKDSAEELGVSTSTIGKYETDKRKPDYEVINRIADFFGVTTDWLLGREEENRTEKSPKFLTEVKEFEIIPVVGTIAAGEPVFAEQNIIDYRKVPTEEDSRKKKRN